MHQLEVQPQPHALLQLIAQCHQRRDGAAALKACFQRLLPRRCSCSHLHMQASSCKPPNANVRLIAASTGHASSILTDSLCGSYRQSCSIVHEVGAELVQPGSHFGHVVGSLEGAPPAWPPVAPAGLDCMPGHRVLQGQQLAASLSCHQEAEIYSRMFWQVCHCNYS